MSHLAIKPRYLSHGKSEGMMGDLGTGIQVLGNTTGYAGYNVTLDGAPESLQGVSPDNEILVAFQNLSDAYHTLSITTVIPAASQGMFYFDKAVISFDAPSSSSPDPQTLKDNNISLQGNWGFENGTSESLHESVTEGDSARTTFSGAAILLSGTTSPQGGTYSVVLDNVTSKFSGQATFTNSDTVLFFATGLDPTIEHDIEIVNDDGSDLSLKVGGFQAFATGLVTTSTPTPTPTPEPALGISAARSKGTIAALVLAGILGFLILSGCLYYSFVVRSRRRRRMQARIARRIQKEHEVDDMGVIDIGPLSLNDDRELGTQTITVDHQQRSSGKSGFSRWKREVEGGFGTLSGIGITFRHSESTGRKSRVSGKEGEALSAKSSIFSLSSSKRGKGKKKAKATHVSESSWSPSFAVELPVRPDSADSYKEKDAGPSHLSPDPHLSITSGLNTLSYMNTPSPRSTPNPAPPSYSISSSNRNSNSNSLSVPHSTRHHSALSSHTHGQPDNGPLVISDVPKPDLLEDDLAQSHEPPVQHVVPSDPGYLSTFAARDRGSAQYSSDDAASYLGSAATRLAIRSLSPRTNEFPRESSGEQINTRDSRSLSDRAVESKMAPPGQRTSPPHSDTSFLNVITPATRPVEMPPTEVPEVPPGPYLDVAPSSPFAISFSHSASHQARRSSSDLEYASGDGSSEKRDPRTLRSIFRLTPPSLGLRPSSTGHWRDSFLDFGASSDISRRSRSIAPSEVTNQNNNEAEQSRWSETASQATGLSRNPSSNVSVSIVSPSSGPTSYFPYPISLPPSPHHPEGHIPSRVDPSILAPRGPRPAERYPARALRLSAFASPTDSVPISVRERVLRHSGSTEGSGNLGNSSQLPPHPPLPDMPPDVTPSPP
ncbi:hypothetical protein H0H92_009695 [Tricholoma furcatifolium]|nr:hypothetical protein H0H92_009695 [Tricholoma furcatifolium]